MAKKREPKTWLPESRCPIIPAAGLVVVELMPEETGKIDIPNHMLIHHGVLKKACIVAIPTPDMESDAFQYQTSGVWKPGDIVWARVSPELRADLLDWFDAKTGKRREFYIVPEGSIVGRSRFDKKDYKEAE